MRVTESRFKHSEASTEALFSGHKWVNNYFSGKSDILKQLTVKSLASQ
jgi:hypothetical protein